MIDEMPIKALAPWFGSKRRLASRIVAELGPHAAYWEPFCGAMAVLLAKPPCRMETVNDLHGDLVNLARVIKHHKHGPALYRRLRRTLMHETLFHECAERYRDRGHFAPIDDPDVDRAYGYFWTSWVGRNGVSGTSSFNQGFSARYTKNGGHAATRTSSAVRSIPSWRLRLRNVTILNRDGFEVIEKIEDATGVVIYVDPPYLAKGAKYVHDFESPNHGRLAALLARFKQTRVVVSYYAHPRLDELYAGWTRVDCSLTKSLVNQGLTGQARRGRGRAGGVAN